MPWTHVTTYGARLGRCSVEQRAWANPGETEVKDIENIDEAPYPDDGHVDWEPFQQGFVGEDEDTRMFVAWKRYQERYGE